MCYVDDLAGVAGRRELVEGLVEAVLGAIETPASKSESFTISALDLGLMIGSAADAFDQITKEIDSRWPDHSLQSALMQTHVDDQPDAGQEATALADPTRPLTLMRAMVLSTISAELAAAQAATSVETLRCAMLGAVDEAVRTLACRYCRSICDWAIYDGTRCLGACFRNRRAAAT